MVSISEVVSAGASPRPTIRAHGKQSIRLSTGCRYSQLPKPTSFILFLR